MICSGCKCDFHCRPSHASKRKFCSKSCRIKYGWHSEETKQKLRDILRGPSWWIGKHHSIETKKLMSELKINNPTRYWVGKGEELKKLGYGKWMVGKKASDETKEKHRQQWLGNKNPNWRGGITESNRLLRNTAQYRDWRNSVFKRDDWTCVKCGNRGVAIHADHIKSFSKFHEFRFDVSNGRTLCIPCHKNTPTYLNRWAKVAV